MQRRTQILIALGAAGVLAVSAVAGSALAERKHGQYGQHDMHGMHGGGHHQGMMARQFNELAERYDADQDGEITQAEIDANRAEWHGEFAGDDDAMTLEEFQGLWLKARNLQMVREFQRIDRDGDGRITLEEYQRPMAEFVEELDRTDSQSIGTDDFQRRGKKERQGRADGSPSGRAPQSGTGSAPTQQQ
jgi:hypothetical protein